MTYAINAKILAVDVNSQITDVNAVIGVGFGNSGYGVPFAGAAVVGQTISSSLFTNFRNRIVGAATHQGTVIDLPAVTDLEVGDGILAYTGVTRPDVPVAISNIVANKQSVAAGQSTTIASALSSSRTVAWSTTVNHIFTAKFANQNDARYFFNTGGQILISGSRSGGSVTPQNTDWTDLLTAAGTIIFDGSKYFASTTASQLLNTSTGSGSYSANDWTIYWTTDTVTDANGGKGSTLTFTIEFNDDHTNSFFDTVDGTLVSTIGTRVTSGSFARTPPTLATTNAL